MNEKRERVVQPPEGRWFDPRLLQSTLVSLGYTEPQIVPDSCVIEQEHHTEAL